MGSDRAAMGSYLAGSREPVDQHRKEKLMFSWMLLEGQFNMVGRAASSAAVPEMKPKRERHLNRYGTELIDSPLLSLLITFINSCYLISSH